jgi:hypothetical protein
MNEGKESTLAVNALAMEKLRDQWIACSVRGKLQTLILNMRSRQIAQLHTHSFPEEFFLCFERKGGHDGSSSSVKCVPKSRTDSDPVMRITLLSSSS